MTNDNGQENMNFRSIWKKVKKSACVHVFAQHYAAELTRCLDPLKQKLLICFHVFAFISFWCLKVFKLSNITIFELALILAICEKQAR